MIYGDGTACMVANGKNFAPYSGSQPYKQKKDKNWCLYMGVSSTATIPPNHSVKRSGAVSKLLLSPTLSSSECC